MEEVGPWYRWCNGRGGTMIQMVQWKSWDHDTGGVMEPPELLRSFLAGVVPSFFLRLVSWPELPMRMHCILLVLPVYVYAFAVWMFFFMYFIHKDIYIYISLNRVCWGEKSQSNMYLQVFFVCFMEFAAVHVYTCKFTIIFIYKFFVFSVKRLPF